jgi:hypothetical protein
MKEDSITVLDGDATEISDGEAKSVSSDDAVACCTCVFGLIKMKFRRLIVLISDDVFCCSVLRGRRLI